MTRVGAGEIRARDQRIDLFRAALIALQNFGLPLGGLAGLIRVDAGARHSDVDAAERAHDRAHAPTVAMALREARGGRGDRRRCGWLCIAEPFFAGSRYSVCVSARREPLVARTAERFGEFSLDQRLDDRADATAHPVLELIVPTVVAQKRPTRLDIIGDRLRRGPSRLGRLLPRGSGVDRCRAVGLGSRGECWFCGHGVISIDRFAPVGLAR